MTREDFNALLDRRLQKTIAVLTTKEEEYATDDRLHSFKVAAKLLRHGLPSQALLGMLVKHWVSIMDMVEGRPYTAALIDEKIGDAINYLCLLEAVLKEAMP